MKPEVLYALSLKQPWAALLALGVKTIEVRRWPTRRRGIILIHASKQVDDRPEAWNHVPRSATALAKLHGGIIGAAELMACIPYRTQAAFALDQRKHLNEPDWFQPPLLYGFRFARPRILPFQRLPGWFKFFPVELQNEQRQALESLGIRE